MLMKTLTFLILASATIAAPAVEIRDAPDPSQVTIAGIVTSGSGCATGTVGQFLSDDRQTFTLIFDKYEAQIGPGSSASDARKFCQINLNLHYPQGFQYSILKTIYRGFAGMDKGVTGIQQATYYFSGQSAQVSTKSTFTGPLQSNYAIEDDVPFESVVWAPCGANLPLNIKSSVSLASSDPKAKGLLTDDSVDGNIQFVTGIQWRRCTK